MKNENRQRKPIPASEYFGENTFNIETMERTLPEEAFQKVVRRIEEGGRLDLEVANTVATALKDWAVARGCTHYTHWFQPMTGYTAEKHDSFISLTDKGKVIEVFSGKELIQGEPDASSFPSGGIRSTFEARGYTIWDPTSPSFIIRYPHGNTLCIPSVFISYTGEALDKKAPLLRSIEALNNASLEILRLFESEAQRVFSTLGVEQEYFLVSRDLYERRPDLIQTGRTLFGNPPSKHQQLEDQYFGNISERAFAFMTEVEEEAYRLGIPLKTRHNEVAPNQFEAAPIHEEANIAVDHNQIIMDLMDRVAVRHRLAVLFHEKPFNLINGNGKHCNWSLATNEGENLLNPGKTPHSNLQFLVFLVATIKAVHDHAREFRAAISSAANDYRLGANEAPPAIMSVFVGENLTRVLDDLAAGRITEDTEAAWISVGIDKIPEISRDNTDRNRTSPFAFTGNKFEFRAVGGSATPATALTVLNTAVADKLLQLGGVIKESIASGRDFNTAVVAAIRTAVQQSRSVLFEGDNYSEEWIREAERRGLPNIRTTPEALEAIISESSRDLFTRNKVYNERELEARYNINMDNYIHQVQIESDIILKMATTMIFPAALHYAGELSHSLQGLEATLGREDPAVQAIRELLGQISENVGKMRNEMVELRRLLREAEGFSAPGAKGRAFVAVRRQGEQVREAADALELLVEHNLWPIPKSDRLLLTL